MKFFTALKQAEFAQKLCTAAGFNFEEAFAKGDEGALKAHLAALAPSADVAEKLARVSALSEEVSALNAALGSAKVENEQLAAALSSEKQSAALIASGLAAAGVKLPSATAEKPLDQAAIAGAVEARASLKAREILAKNGVNDPVPAEASSDASKPGGKNGEMSLEAYMAMTPAARLEFCKNGGRIV